MKTIRRIYLYAVASLSLEVVLWGLIGLVRSVFSTQVGGGASQLARALALILVGTPVFLLHGWLAQRGALQDIEERSARVRAIALYGILFATLIPSVQNFMALLNRLLLKAFGLGIHESMFGGYQSLSDNLIAIVMNLLVGWYIFLVLRKDWQAPLQGEAFHETRRMFRYLWLIYASVMVIGAAQQSLQFLFELPMTGEGVSGVQMAGGLTLLLSGAPLWYFTWRVIQRSLSHPSEKYSILRLIVLYLFAFAGVGSVLASIGVVTKEILVALLRGGLKLAMLMGDNSQPLSVALAFGCVWAYYGRTLRAEVSALPDTPHRSGLRRLYLYVLALAGLITAFSGLYLLFAFMFDLGLGYLGWGRVLQMQLAISLSTLLIGLPLWIITWRPLVSEAAQHGEAGDHARRSLVRKSYLYLSLFAGVMGVMFSAGSLLFQLLSALLGDAAPNLALEVTQLLKTLGLFVLLLVYHWWVLRGDGRIAERSLAERHAQFPVLLLAPDNGDFAEALANALQRQAPEMPVAVHSYGQGVPDETLSAARAVILPSELAARPPEGLRVWLQGFSGVRLVLPTPMKDWHWVFGSGRSLASLAKQTAAVIRRLAEGEEISPPRESSTWMVAVYIMAGLFALEVVIWFVAMLVSLFLG